MGYMRDGADIEGCGVEVSLSLVDGEWHPDSKKGTIGARVHIRESRPKTLLQPGGTIHSEHFVVQQTDIWFYSKSEARGHFRALLPAMVARYNELASTYSDWRREDEKI